MWVSLVAHVPDDAIFWRVEYIMQSDRKFDDAQARTEMPAGGRSGIDCFGAQFIGQLTQLRLWQMAQIADRLKRV